MLWCCTGDTDFDYVPGAVSASAISTAVAASTISTAVAAPTIATALTTRVLRNGAKRSALSG